MAGQDKVANLYGNGWRILVLLTSLMVTCTTAAQSAQLANLAYDTAGMFDAAVMLEPRLLKGKHFTLESKVRNDGLFNHYLIHSSFGDFRAISGTSLKIRLLEIEAIAAMREVDTSGAALDGLKQSGGKALTGAKNLLTHPIKTIEGAAQGAGDIYNRTTGTVRRNLGDTEDGALAQLIGYSKLKGAIASRYGINVYSRNLVLQQELDRLAQAGFLGGLGLGLASSFVPGVSGLMLSTSSAARVLNDTINDTPASEIWLQNKSRLNAMKLGLHNDQLELFLNNAIFSPALQTVMVAALEALEGVENRLLLVELSARVRDVHRANTLTQITVMAARYHKNIASLGAFVPMAKLVSLVAVDGEMVILLPADYVLWTEKFNGVASTLSARARLATGGAPALWVLGRVSPRTRAELHKRKWKVRAQAGPLLRIKKH